MAPTRHNTSCREVKLNLKKFLQGQRLHSARETWTIHKFRLVKLSRLVNDLKTSENKHIM